MKGVLLRLAGLTRNFRLNLARIDAAAGQNNAAVGLSERLLGRTGLKTDLLDRKPVGRGHGNQLPSDPFFLLRKVHSFQSNSVLDRTLPGRG